MALEYTILTRSVRSGTYSDSVRIYSGFGFSGFRVQKFQFHSGISKFRFGFGSDLYGFSSGSDNPSKLFLKKFNSLYTLNFSKSINKTIYYI